MAESLFTSQTPAATDGTDGGAAGITTATGMGFAVNGTVSAIRFYSAITTGGTYTVELWRDFDNALLGTASVGSGSVVSGTWNTVALPSPVAVTPLVSYRAAMNNNHNQGLYVATSGFFSVPLTNGNITGWADNQDPYGGGPIKNGTFQDDHGPGIYPNLRFGSSCYFIDVVFNATVTASTSDFFNLF